MGIRSWWRQTRPSVDQTKYDVLDEVVPDDEDLYGFVSERMLPGYTRFDDLVEDLVDEYREALETEPDRTEETFRADVTWTARALWHGRRLDEADQAALAASEHHRVAAAFAALSRDGIVTGEHLGVDQTSAFALARGARDRTPDGGYEQWAYAFFHEQDAAAVCEPPASLRIAYGAFSTSPSIDDRTVRRALLTTRGRAALEQRSRQAAGQRVADALEAAGLSVAWNGDTRTRITVHVDRWLRPLPVIDLEEARDVAEREGLRIRWPEDPALADALTALVAQARAARSDALRVPPHP